MNQPLTEAYAVCLDDLAELYQSWGLYHAAELLYIEALIVRKQLLGQLHPNVAASLKNLAYLYQLQGHYSKAKPLYIQALILSKQLRCPD